MTKKLALLEDESEQIKSQIKENTKKFILKKENLQNNKQNYFVTNQKKFNKKILDIFV